MAGHEDGPDVGGRLANDPDVQLEQHDDHRSRRLVFASPLNTYSPAMRSSYDPARQPAKPLLVRHSMPPARNSTTVGNHSASWTSNDTAWLRTDDSQSLASIRLSPPPDCMRMSPAARSWAELLGRHASADGAIAFEQFQCALGAGDECSIVGLAEVREDADGLWNALVGAHDEVGAASEVAELLTVACSERAMASSSPPVLVGHRPSDADVAPQSVDMPRNEHEHDVCNLSADSAHEAAEAMHAAIAAGSAATRHDKDTDSMERLQDFLVQQPHAAGTAIDEFEGFLAQTTRARSLTLPARRDSPALTAALAAAESRLQATHDRDVDSSHMHQIAHGVTSDMELAKVSPAAAPQPSASRVTQMRGYKSPEKPSAAAQALAQESPDELARLVSDAADGGGGITHPGPTSPGKTCGNTVSVSPHTIALSLVLALLSLLSVRVGASDCVCFSEPMSGSVAVYVYDIDMLTDRLSQHRCLHMRLYNPTAHLRMSTHAGESARVLWELRPSSTYESQSTVISAGLGSPHGAKNIPPESLGALRVGEGAMSAFLVPPQKGSNGGSEEKTDSGDSFPVREGGRERVLFTTHMCMQARCMYV